MPVRPVTAEDFLEGTQLDYLRGMENTLPELIFFWCSSLPKDEQEAIVESFSNDLDIFGTYIHKASNEHISQSALEGSKNTLAMQAQFVLYIQRVIRIPHSLGLDAATDDAWKWGRCCSDLWKSDDASASESIERTRRIFDSGVTAEHAFRLVSNFVLDVDFIIDSFAAGINIDMAVTLEHPKR